MNQQMIDKLTRWGAEQRLYNDRQFLFFYPADVGRTLENVAALSSDSADDRAAALKAIQAAKAEYKAAIGYSRELGSRTLTLNGKTYTGADAYQMDNEIRNLQLIRYEIENDKMFAGTAMVNEFHREIMRAIRNA